VIDFFGGFRDLREGVIRVLHNLSFIEDPTRIFRAVRYENRYGFRMDEQTHGFARSCVDMHLVGDLSSVRLRDELVALLSEGDVDWTLGRLFELGVAREVHPKLATGAKTVALVQKLDALVAELGLQSEVVLWRLRLAAVTRNMTHDELYVWLERLKLRRADSQPVTEAVVVGPLLTTRLATPDMRDWDVYRALRRIPLEAVLFALALVEPGAVEDRLRRYLADIRHRTLTVGGEDLLAMGMKKGPAVGRVLEKLQELRVEGSIKDRTAELEAASRMVGMSA
jgi:tRNA nucleotidyltransferase (CCA-adding enzyme)